MPEGQESKKSGFEVKGADGKTIVIPHGEFYINTKARCRRMAQNSLPVEARRCHAALELMTVGFQQEEAVVMERGRMRKAVPDDLVQMTGMERQEVRAGLEGLEIAGLAERFSDDGGALRKGHVHIRSWAEPRPARIQDCRGAPLQFPDWWPNADPETPCWTDSWTPLRSLARRLKLSVSVDEESARSYKMEGDEVARKLKEAEIVAARFLERVCAQKRPNKEERTERTSERTVDSSGCSYTNGSSSSSSIEPEEEEEPVFVETTTPEPESVGSGTAAVRAREPKPSFEEVRKVYPPERLDAGAARTAYQQTVKTPAEHAKVMQGLAKHVACERWCRSLEEDNPSGRFIPLASKFIRTQLYLDDPPPYLAKPGTEEAVDPVIEMLRKQGYK